MSDVVELTGCVLSNAVVDTTVTDDGKLEVGKTVDDVEAGGTIALVEAVELRGSVSLEVAAVDETDVEPTVASLVGTFVVGTPVADVVVSVEVVTVPDSVALDVKLLTPLVTGAVLVVEGG